MELYEVQCCWRRTERAIWRRGACACCTLSALQRRLASRVVASPPPGCTRWPTKSSVDGLQGPAYYLHNGGLAFNLALLLALGLPLLAALQHLCRRTVTASARSPTAGVGAGADARQSAGQRRKGWQGALSDGGVGVWSRGVAALAPLWLWLTVISLLPHKEERFLYVVYPLVGFVDDTVSLVVRLEHGTATCSHAIYIQRAAPRGSTLCCCFEAGLISSLK